LVNDAPALPLGGGSIDLVGSTGQTVATHQVQSWPSAPIQTSQCLPGLTVRYDLAVLDKYPMPTPRRVQGQQALSGAGCDASLVVSPKSQLRYWVRLVNQDTVLPTWANVIPIVNGVNQPAVGSIPANTLRWIDLGPCQAVGTFDFIIQFHEPNTGTLRTVTPEPPHYQALPICQDSIALNLGGQIY
jgi:hypothetical protein